MAYAVCVRARITSKDHWRDNSLTGTLEFEGETYRYKTRGHIVKAVNSRYSDVNWKPEEGDEVIIDGEIHKDQFIIDHIEPWRPEDHKPLGRHDDLLQRLLDKMPKTSEMSKLMRQRAHNDEGTQVRCIRWMKDAKCQEGRKEIPVVLSAICAENEIRFAARSKSGGRLIDNSKVAVLPLIVQALGIPMAEVSSGKPKPKQPAQPRSGNPNKWIHGRPYHPDEMPDDYEMVSVPTLEDQENPFQDDFVDDVPF